MMIWLAQQTVPPPDESLIIWGGVLLAVALVLLFVELFVPSGGLIGVLAGIAAIASVVAFARYDRTLGIAMGGAYFILTPVIIWAMFKFWITSPMTRKLILGAEEMDAESPGSSKADQARRERLAQLQALIGAEGVAITPLRPVGVVRIQGERVDALAETGVIDASEAIVVTDVYDNQVKVRAKK